MEHPIRTCPADPAGARPVLVITSDDVARVELIESLRRLRYTAFGASRVCELETWPVGWTVLADTAFLTPFWREVGAYCVVALGQPLHRGRKAGRVAQAWLPSTATGHDVDMLLRVLAAGSGVPVQRLLKPKSRPN